MTHRSLLLLLATALAGCSFNASYSGSGRWYSGKPDAIFVTSAPPAAPAETPGTCGGSKVWVFGHWDWRGKEWRWVDGACRAPEPAGSEWVGPVLTEVEGGFELVPGHWAPSSSGGERDVVRTTDERDRARAGGAASGRASVGAADDGKHDRKPGRRRGPVRRKPSDEGGATAAAGGGGARGAAGGDARAEAGADRGKKPVSKPSGASDGGNADEQPDGKPGRGRRGTAGSGAMASASGSGGVRARGADEGSAEAAEGSAAERRRQRGRRGDEMAEATGPAIRAGEKPATKKPESATTADGATGAASRSASGARPAGGGELAEAKPAARSDETRFSCKLLQSRRKPGQRLIIKTAGVPDEAQVFFGEDEVKVEKQNRSTLHVEVPEPFDAAVAVAVVHGGDRTECGKLAPASAKRPAKRVKKPASSKDKGKRKQ